MKKSKIIYLGLALIILIFSYKFLNGTFGPCDTMKWWYQFVLIVKIWGKVYYFNEELKWANPFLFRTLSVNYSKDNNDVLLWWSLFMVQNEKY